MDVFFLGKFWFQESSLWISTSAFAFLISKKFSYFSVTTDMLYFKNMYIFLISIFKCAVLAGNYLNLGFNVARNKSHILKKHLIYPTPTPKTMNSDY